MQTHSYEYGASQTVTSRLRQGPTPEPTNQSSPEEPFKPGADVQLYSPSTLQLHSPPTLQVYSPPTLQYPRPQNPPSEPTNQSSPEEPFKPGADVQLYSPPTLQVYSPPTLQYPRPQNSPSEPSVRPYSVNDGGVNSKAKGFAATHNRPGQYCRSPSDPHPSSGSGASVLPTRPTMSSGDSYNFPNSYLTDTDQNQPDKASVRPKYPGAQPLSRGQYPKVEWKDPEPHFLAFDRHQSTNAPANTGSSEATYALASDPGGYILGSPALTREIKSQPPSSRDKFRDISGLTGHPAPKVDSSTPRSSSAPTLDTFQSFRVYKPPHASNVANDSAICTALLDSCSFGPDGNTVATYFLRDEFGLEMQEGEEITLRIVASEEGPVQKGFEYSERFTVKSRRHIPLLLGRAWIKGRWDDGTFFTLKTDSKKKCK
ncbi:hypothetical protein LTR84_007420 [Exophiala bonariae]|uniref:Velvet domain-containing protein n=1 Tax=Exophiala bonariae TaxID=1690606 RepID=A0AAV9N186_9EURO|nr:hypothetical protein LTR84_007420 [Exophiala bonariae]